jgi:para-nitrobenzyl esterase
MMVFRLGLRACLAVGLLGAGAAGAATYDTVKIDTGTLRGVAADHVISFKGIPYAAPPVGPLRWRAPQPAASWQGTRMADRFGNICIPASDEMDNFPGRPPASEDCLTLNVWRPQSAAGQLPVLVWIHGGGLVAGSSTLPAYDGAAFAKRGIILVSMNYRLGKFGFFAHPALSKENADDGRLANYGLMDQIAALEWVRRNIAAFGGDPGRVTIFGESAGAASVDILMAIPSARGLFQGAISQSGYGRAPFQHLSTVAPGDTTSAEDDGIALMRAVGVTGDDPAALRAVPATEIKGKTNYDSQTMFILDGKVVPEDLWDAFRNHREAPIPFLLGSNSLEFPPAKDAKPAQIQAMDNFLCRYIKPDERAALYPAYGGEAAFKENLTSDILFGEQARALALLHMKNGAPTYRYRFSAVAASVADTLKGAPHASEIPYVFNTLSAAHWQMSARDRKLADAMTAYWVAFATYGAPKVKGLPPWPMATDDNLIDFTDDGPKPMQDPRRAALDALSKVIDPRS